jgi:hypothetical protein
MNQQKQSSLVCLRLNYQTQTIIFLVTIPSFDFVRIDFSLGMHDGLR